MEIKHVESCKFSLRDIQKIFDTQFSHLPFRVYRKVNAHDHDKASLKQVGEYYSETYLRMRTKHSY